MKLFYLWFEKLSKTQRSLIIFLCFLSLLIGSLITETHPKITIALFSIPFCFICLWDIGWLSE